MTTPPPDGNQPPRLHVRRPRSTRPTPRRRRPRPQYSGPPPSRPGRTLGIVAFVLSFFAQLIALILGIVALVQSKRAGQKNGWAVAAIIISSVLMVVGIIVGIWLLAVFLPQAAQFTQEILDQCRELGPGVHEINGVHDRLLRDSPLTTTR